VIEVAGLVFAYRGATEPAVNDLEFAVEDGEIFGFLGPNGAGKSTTQKLLIGLLRDYSGKVRVFEAEVRDWGSDLYEQIGVGFELPVHYGRLTARENLGYFASLYQGETEDPDELLDQVDLLEQADVRVNRFSKGMRDGLPIHPVARLQLCVESQCGGQPAHASSLPITRMKIRSSDVSWLWIVSRDGSSRTRCRLSPP
jgi:ABC-type multidrug transport system ATPase subunit